MARDKTKKAEKDQKHTTRNKAEYKHKRSWHEVQINTDIRYKKKERTTRHRVGQVINKGRRHARRGTRVTKIKQEVENVTK